MKFQLYSVGLNRRINLSPEYPYVYLPDPDWKKIQDILPSGTCNYDNNFCKLKGSCSQQKASDFDFSFQIRDHEGGPLNRYTIPGKDLLVSGRTLGITLKTDDCFFAVFRSMNGYPTTWYIGNVFFAGRYLVFDQTPLTEHGKDYIQIGIGELDQDADVGEVQYGVD